jgi:RNA polymerase sigma-70 factor (ECF subfamily)
VEAPTDETLLEMYLAGDRASFETLVHRHSRELFQFVLRFTKNSVAAEDVVQETFLQVHTSAASFDISRRFKPWLFTIGANKARDYLRSRSRKREVPIDAHVGGESGQGQRFVELIADDSPFPQDRMNDEERRELVQSIVDDMSPKLWEVLVLAYYHRFPYKDIAETIDVPVGTVKSRLHAAVAQFAERYRAAAEQKDAKASAKGAEKERGENKAPRRT